MYLEDGREIYESDKYPSYYIDANTGAFCTEDGTFVGGNIDEGDRPGERGVSQISLRTVWITKTGHQYYPTRTKSATIAISLSEAQRKKYRPSPGYLSYIHKMIYKRHGR